MARLNPYHLYDVATDPRLCGWEFDLRYMSIDSDWPERRFFYAHPRLFHDPVYISQQLRNQFPHDIDHG
jgi:hypothetical protein